MLKERATGSRQTRRPKARWMRVKEAAEILEVTPQRVSQMLKANIIPHYRIGRAVKIDRSEFEAWLASRRQGPAN